MSDVPQALNELIKTGNQAALSIYGSYNQYNDLIATATDALTQAKYRRDQARVYLDGVKMLARQQGKNPVASSKMTKTLLTAGAIGLPVLVLAMG